MSAQMIRSLRAQRAQLVADAGLLVKSGSFTADVQRRFDEMMVQADSIKAQISRLELSEAREIEMLEAQRSGGATLAGMARATCTLGSLSGDPEIERETFYAYLRHGAAALNDEQRAVFARRFQNAQGTTPDTAGGYTVPFGPMQVLVEAQKQYGGMLEGECTVLDTEGGEPIPIPTNNDTNNVGVRLQENTQAAEQDTTFGTVVLNAFTYSSKIVLVSNQLLDDSNFDIGTFLMNALGVRIGRAVNTDLTVGTGASQPTGAVTASMLGFTAGGSTSSGSTATIAYADLVELEHSVDPAYRKNARFMLSDTTLKVIKKLTDTLGRPLWLPSISVDAPATILGYPYIINQDMAAPAPSAKTMLFGDFSKYYVRRVAAVRVLRLIERYADYNQTGFVAFQRWDGNLIDAGTHPVRYLQQSAS
jgi:HK97 family phage major capsid protein